MKRLNMRDYTLREICRCGWMRKTALNCGSFNSPEFGGIKTLENLYSLLFQNRHLMYGKRVSYFFCVNRKYQEEAEAVNAFSYILVFVVLRNCRLKFSAEFVNFITGIIININLTVPFLTL